MFVEEVREAIHAISELLLEFWLVIALIEMRYHNGSVISREVALVFNGTSEEIDSLCKLGRSRIHWLTHLLGLVVLEKNTF